MSRLIDADKAFEIATEFAGQADTKSAYAAFWKVAKALQEMPAIDAVEVVHGRWEKHGKHDWRCSVCKIGVPYSYTGNKCCHNCGAKMDGHGNG